MSGTSIVDMKGRRVLVVGASSGIGAATAKAIVAAGGDVTVSARRESALTALVSEMGAGHVAAGDASLRADAQRVASEAADAMGGLDLMIYVAGYGPLQKIADCDVDLWADVYRVNVGGANLAASAALEHMDRDGICAFVSSRTVEDANPFFGAYSASKAALDQCIRVWRLEHRDRRFVRIVMGNTGPTDFADNMGDTELLGEALEEWGHHAIPGGMMDVDEVGTSMVASLAVALAHPEIDASELKLDARTA